MAVLLLALIAPPGAAAAQDPEPGFAIGLPIDCTPGTDCLVQNYVDRDPGPGRRDYACGQRTNDGHKGTDFRIPDLAVMRRGVAVLAVAPGRVSRLRDGVADINVRYVDAASIRGRECGNGVLVTHRDGWQSQYCHLRRGSLAVSPGERVAAGQKLGLVGLSGRTEFPHVHLSLRRRGRVVDPFVGPTDRQGCEAPRAPVWRSDLVDVLAYRPTELVTIGFATTRPVLAAVALGRHRKTFVSSRVPALAFWALVAGLRKGDRIAMRLAGPDGAPITARTLEPMGRNRAQGFTAVMKVRRAPRWPAGSYRGTYRIDRRVGATTLTVIEVTRELLVK